MMVIVTIITIIVYHHEFVNPYVSNSRSVLLSMKLCLNVDSELLLSLFNMHPIIIFSATAIKQTFLLYSYTLLPISTLHMHATSFKGNYQLLHVAQVIRPYSSLYHVSCVTNSAL